MRNDKLLFRASGIGNLASKREPKNGGLSETAKTWVREMWLQNEFGFREQIKSKYLDKGNSMEEVSISLFSEVTGNFYTKNTERKDNGLISGECDLYNSERVVDIKTSWNLKTYMNGELSLIYEYQLRAYMELWDLDKATLAYCLVDATEDMVLNEQQKAFYKHHNIDESFEQDESQLRAYELECEQIRKNLIVSDRIPKEQRVKQFHIERDDEKMAYIYKKINTAIDYYNGLKLN